MNNLAPLITSAAGLIIILGPIAYIARSTRNRLVARERRDSVQEAYRRALPPTQIEAQLRNRDERLEKAKAAHRMWAWAMVLLTAAVVAVTIVMVTQSVPAPWSYLINVAASVAAGVIAGRLFGHKVTFPDLPERRPRAEVDDLDAAPAGLTDTPKGTVTAKNTRAIVKKADPKTRARRKQVQASRKRNRR